MSFKLTKFLRDELSYYASHYRECAENEDEESRPGFAELADVLDAVLAGRELTEPERAVFADELNQLEDRYEDPKERAEWLRLMAHFGALEVFDPNTQYMPKPRTKMIDGVRYITGRVR